MVSVIVMVPTVMIVHMLELGFGNGAPVPVPSTPVGDPVPDRGRPELEKENGLVGARVGYMPDELLSIGIVELAWEVPVNIGIVPVPSGAVPGPAVPERGAPV